MYGGIFAIAKSFCEIYTRDKKKENERGGQKFNRGGESRLGERNVIMIKKCHAELEVLIS
jgi:hypothetical protein